MTDTSGSIQQQSSKTTSVQRAKKLEARIVIKANIKINGTGNLYLSSHNSEKNIHSTNVIAASYTSDNLLSLRKFADAGYDKIMTKYYI